MYSWENAVFQFPARKLADRDEDMAKLLSDNPPTHRRTGKKRRKGDLRFLIFPRFLTFLPPVAYSPSPSTGSRFGQEEDIIGTTHLGVEPITFRPTPEANTQ